MEKLNIYDNYTIELNKYPRKELNYRITDIILITFMMNLQQLNRLNKCYQEAYNSYNEVKDYYFTFHFTISETFNKKTYHKTNFYYSGQGTLPVETKKNI